MTISLSNFRIGLRTKLFFLSAFLFLIPLLGYQYVWEMEKYLRIGQEKTLVGTVRAAATALHERPKLFDQQASFLPTVQAGRDLYAYPVVDPIRLDGKLNDWRNQQWGVHYGRDYVIEGSAHYRENSLHFTHRVGKYRKYLYAYFEVIDDQVIYRPSNSRLIDQNDLLQIAFVTPAGDFRRYLVANKNPGWLTAYELDTNSTFTAPLGPEPRIQGSWIETNKGYNIELRIPLELLGSQLSFAITDIDIQTNTDNKPTPPVTIGTAPFNRPDDLGTVLVPSPEIERIIKGLGHAQSKIWVVDQHGRVLATAGDIKNSSGVWSSLANQTNNKTDNGLSTQIQQLLNQLYAHILTTPPKDFVDELKDAIQLSGSHLDKALKGQSAANWRLTPDNKAVILSAAHPIFVEGEVLGAVVAEETTHGIRSLRNQALQQWFNIILAVMILGTAALLLFASRISSRIRDLRNQTEQAIDEQGKIVSVIKPEKNRDEIGDLQRSFANIMGRLDQYNQYLQGMSARLSHELRTPVAVVRSSLESLELDSPEIKNNVYLERATEGVGRLSSILTLMSEATRLEQSLQTTEKTIYPIPEVVKGCVQGYQLTQPQQLFSCNCEFSDPVYVEGNPELLAQMLDKLLANAVEFAAAETEIAVNLEQDKSTVILSVINQGPCLPEEMRERLFDSMVSVRKSESQDQTPHLGFGLYIARLVVEFHQGSIELKNVESDTGVKVSVALPICVNKP